MAEKENDKSGAGGTGGGNLPGLVDLAKNAGRSGEEKRGRGRPAGSGNKSTGPVVPACMVPLWNTGNAGSLIRLPFAGAAMFTGIKELALSPDDEVMIVPPAVEVLNQFAPMAAAKYASVFALLGGVMAVGGIKYGIFAKAVKEKAAKQKIADEEKKRNAINEK